MAPRHYIIFFIGYCRAIHKKSIIFNFTQVRNLQKPGHSRADQHSQQQHHQQPSSIQTFHNLDEDEQHPDGEKEHLR